MQALSSSDLLSALLEPNVRAAAFRASGVLALAAIVASLNLVCRGLCCIFLLIEPKPSTMKVLWLRCRKVLFVAQYLLEIASLGTRLWLYFLSPSFSTLFLMQDIFSVATDFEDFVCFWKNFREKKGTLPVM